MEDHDSFLFNEGFTAPLYRIKVHLYDRLGSETSFTVAGEAWNVNEQ